MEEVWKDVTGWEGRYRVSNYGRVQSLIRSNKIRVENFYMSKRVTNGYECVNFCKKQKGKKTTKSWSIHRLVATHFVDGDNQLDVAHLDGNKLNNLSTNLKWVTKQENESHKILHGTKVVGSMVGTSKLCERCVMAIMKLRKTGLTCNTIAELFGVSESNISAIERKVSWGHLTALESLESTDGGEDK